MKSYKHEIFNLREPFPTLKPKKKQVLEKVEYVERQRSRVLKVPLILMVTLFHRTTTETRLKIYIFFDMLFLDSL